MQLYGMVVAKEYETYANMVSVFHPKNPAQVQKQFLKAAHAARNPDAKPIWQDPKRFKRWLSGAVPGVGVKEDDQGEGPGISVRDNPGPDVLRPEKNEDATQEG